MLNWPNPIRFCKGPLKCSVSQILVNSQLRHSSQKISSHIFSVLTGNWGDYNCCFSPWASLNFYWNLLGFVIDFNRIRLRPLSESLLLAASLISMWYICKLSVIMLPLKWKIDKLLSLGACWAQIGSIRSQVNWHQARLQLSSLCLILKWKATCLVGCALETIKSTWDYLVLSEFCNRGKGRCFAWPVD